MAHSQLHTQFPRIAVSLAWAAVVCVVGLSGGLQGCGTAPAEGSLKSPPGVSAPSPVIAEEEAVTRGTVLAEDGLEIAYDARGAGDVTLVFVHCWACDRSFWSEQLDAFAKDYRVVALDLGGHGASGREREAWYLQDLAGDVKAVVEELGLDRVILVGHSMGGPISLEAARLLGLRVEGVVCVDTLHNAEITITDQMVERMAGNFEGSFANGMDGFVRSAFPPGADPELIARIQERARATNPQVALQLLRDFPNMELSGLLSRAGVPVRCINSGNSPTRTEINQKYGDFQAVILDDVSHFLILEAPEVFNEALRQVLLELADLSDSL